MRIRAFLLIFLLFLSPWQSFGDQLISQKTIILLDTSGSMRGAQLERAKVLILDTLQKRETSSEFEIYTFAESVSPISTEYTSLTQLQSQISTISAGSRTSLYDSINYLVPIADSAGADIIVLSDGDDSQSRITFNQLLYTLSNQDVRISFLSQFIDPQFLASVENIVQQSEGFILDQIPLRPLDSKAIKQDSPAESTGLPLTLALGTTLLSYLVLSKGVHYRKRKREIRLDKELLRRATDGTNKEEKVSSKFSRSISRASEALDINTYLITSQQRSLFALLVIISFLLLLQITRSWLLGAVITLIGAIVALRTKLSHEENKRIRAFEKELPGALKMLAGSLSAGLSFLQALSAYANDGQGESAREFRRALTEIQLGIPIERALESIAVRMKSDDLGWAVSAFAIQREVGGSLATILYSTAETIEARFDLRREVRTLSAEGRISSYILMALPVGIFLFLSFLRPEYVGFFITESIGNLLVLVILLALSMAWFWLRSLVRISV